MTWAEPRRLPVLLAAATLIPICVLSWLGLRILQQDRDAERQRRRDALSVAAGRLALDIPTFPIPASRNGDLIR